MKSIDIQNRTAHPPSLYRTHAVLRLNPGKLKSAGIFYLQSTPFMPPANENCKHLGACDITFPWVKQMVQGLLKSGKDGKQ